jgi:cytidine deaminase
MKRLNSDSIVNRTKALTSCKRYATAGPRLVVTGEELTMLTSSFIIPAHDVQSLMKRRRNMDVESLLTSLIQPASALARPPISNYHVGAAGLAGSGAIYLGVNLELRGAPLNNSIHAEQFLATSLVQAGEERLISLAVSAAPCGHCRQFYAELHRADEIRFLFGDEASMEARTLDDLLPLRFGPQDLIGPDGSLLLQPQHHDLQLTRASEAKIKAMDAALVTASHQAMKEASSCYCPYTLCPAGVSIILQNGSVFSGGCIESAAYNPTLSPLHTAYISACIGGMKSLEEIKKVVLLERKGAKVQYSTTVKLILKSVAPSCTLTTLHFK